MRWCKTLGHGLIALCMALALSTALASANQLRIVDAKQGVGSSAQLGKIVRFQYEGRLADGPIFDSSYENGKPLQFVLGKGLVIPGLEQGIIGMREGGRRNLVIPPDLAFGEKGVKNIIPPSATLEYKLELIAVHDAVYKNLGPKGLAEWQSRGATIVDIRTPEEWAQTGIIEGSATIMAFSATGRLSPSFIGQFSALVEQSEPVILVCRSGNRTQAIARSLTQDVGYSNVYHLSGGLKSWTAANHQLVPYPSP